MTCPGCYSSELVAGECWFCGLQVSVERELALKAELPPFRTRDLEEARLEHALRQGDD